MATEAIEGAHPLAPHFLPPYIPQPDGSDWMLTSVAALLFMLIVLIGVGYLKLHALPEHMANETNRAQFQLVSILAILALFTHNNLWWVAALLLAVVQIPDFAGPLHSISRSLNRIADKMADDGTAKGETDA